MFFFEKNKKNYRVFELLVTKRPKNSIKKIDKKQNQVSSCSFFLGCGKCTSLSPFFFNAPPCPLVPGTRLLCVISCHINALYRATADCLRPTSDERRAAISHTVHYFLFPFYIYIYMDSRCTKSQLLARITARGTAQKFAYVAL
jgi:hypothetical protein